MKGYTGKLIWGGGPGGGHVPSLMRPGTLNDLDVVVDDAFYEDGAHRQGAADPQPVPE